MRYFSPLAPAVLIVALALAADGPRTGEQGVVRPRDRDRDLTDIDRTALAARFARRIWPMMSEPDDPTKGCIACHRDDASNTSPLVVSGDPFAVFARLLADGYFDKGRPSSVLARVAHQDPRERMPPVPARPWSPGEIATLRAFVEEMAASPTR